MAVNNFQAGGIDNHYNTVGNWSLGAVPTAADGNTATFTASSPNCDLNGANRVANNIDFTNYTHTIDLAGNNLTVSGNVTFGSGMHITSSGGVLNQPTAGTLTSNGFTFPVGLQLNGGVIHTLLDNCSISGLLIIGGGNNATVINGFQFTCTGGIRYNGTTGNCSGTTPLIFAGGNLDAPNRTSGRLINNLTYNGVGTLTIDGTVQLGGTQTYTAGTMSFINSAQLIFLTATTFNISGPTWCEMSLGGSVTDTLSADFTCTKLTGNTITGTTVVNGNTIHVTGDTNFTALTTGTWGGTTVISMEGTGTIDMTSVTTGELRSPLTIASASNTTTINTLQTAANITYTSGTVAGTRAITTQTSPVTITINAPGLTLTTVNENISTTYAGTNGLTIGTLKQVSDGISTVLQSGNTYSVPTLLVLNGHYGGTTSISASTPSSAAFLNLGASATQDITHISATDINSSGGKAIYNYQGTDTRTVNWNILPSIPTTSGSFMALDLSTGGLRYVNGKLIIF